MNTMFKHDMEGEKKNRVSSTESEYEQIIM